MEGYSVMEAASILGVPSERVWELLARGVLAGAQEGETGMRVYLRAQPTPAPQVPLGEGPVARPEPERELSPFRELLTEFRNLTERYGQALLALGEARGEVASLRSRVDLLEARVDLRLPASPSAPTGPWMTPRVSPSVTEPSPRQAGPADTGPEPTVDEASAGTEPDTTAEAAHPTRRRRNGQRHATENFAEALARAEDPSPPELLSPADAAAALAAARGAWAAETEDLSPREAAPADEMPVADVAVAPNEAATGVDAESADAPQIEPPPTRDVEVTAAGTERTEALGPVGREPVDVSDEGDVDAAGERLAAHDAAMAASAADEVVDAEETGFEVPPHADEPIAERPAPDLTAVDRLGDASERVDSGPPEEMAVQEPEPEADAAWDRDRYSTTIEEPDWYLLEEQVTVRRDDAVDSASSPPRPHAPPDLSAQRAGAQPDATTAPADPSPASERDVISSGDAPRGPDATADQGADEIEFAAHGRESRPRANLPGSRELDDALAALDAVAGGSARSAESPASPSPVGSESASPRTLPHSLRGPTAIPPSPASRAYRRLRRIFPG